MKNDGLHRQVEELQRRLQESEEKCHRLSDAAFEALLFLEDGRPTEVNSRFQDMFHWTAEELRSADAPLYLAPASRPLIAAHIDKRRDQPFEAVGNRKDGSMFDVEARLTHFLHRGKKLCIVAIRDVTHEKSAQEKMHRRALFAKYNPGPALRCDAEGRLQTANPASRKIFDIDDIDARRLHDILPEAKAFDLAKAIREDALFTFLATRGTDIYQFTVRGVSALGVVQIYGSDITEQKELEHRFEAIISSANDAIIMIDDAGRTAVWNNAAERIFGYAAREIVGKPMADFIIPAEYQQPHREGVRAFRATGKGKNAGKTLELSALRKGGERFPIEISYATPVNLKGRWHAVAIIRDITKRKELEDQLKRTAAELEIILESAGVGIALIEGGKFSWCNRFLLEIFGGEREDFYGKEVLTFLPPGDSAPPFATDGAAESAPEKTYQAEVELTRLDGRRFWGRLLGKPIDPADPARGEIYIIEDFSGRKEMEENLRAAKETAEEATKLKDKFVSLVAHDLKSPFNSLLGFLKLLATDREQPLHHSHEKLVALAIDSGQGLVRMIEELLKISRLQTGKMVPRPRFFDGHLSAGYAVGNLVNVAREKGVALINDVPRGTRLFADINLFGEVLQNLVSNALKFSNEGGRVSVFVPKGAETTIAVKDTGVGIPEKYLRKIFRHEENVSTRGTRGETGTGLGLPFSHDIMAAHGGSLRVESQEGEGSTFYADLPEKKPVILIVEDDEPTRFMLKENLRRCDTVVLEAETADEAMKKIDERLPHLILTDIALSKASGYDLLAWLRKNQDTKETPVIVITASADIEARERAFQLGADDFITKPVQSEDLLPRVKRFLG